MSARQGSKHLGLDYFIQSLQQPYEEANILNPFYE